MPTASTFTKRLTLADIPKPAKSVGAHLASKLQLFHTDERTLTDELCDMLCIWLGMETYGPPKTMAPTQFSLTLSKTTTSEEVKNGADLELFISSPLGVKRCLIQAKVLDPATGMLRCATAAGWKKLRSQLVAARKEVGELAFLLVYVPAQYLDGDDYEYGTYEQSLCDAGVTLLPSYFGATLIAADDLLGPSGRWRHAKLKVPQRTTGHFKNGVPLWQVLLELLLCRRSHWKGEQLAVSTMEERKMVATRRLLLAASDITPDEWSELQYNADQYLSNGRFFDDGSVTGVQS